MKDQLISFETAKLAKEKRFDVPCRLCYTDDDQLRALPFNAGNRDHINSKHEYYSVTTQSLLQKWLMDIHEIYPYVVKRKGLGFDGLVRKINDDGDYELRFAFGSTSGTYEDIFEIVLLSALNLVNV